MVQGTSTMQNAIEKSAAERIALRIRVKNGPAFRLKSAESINVPPMAAAKSPLSGRNMTASPAIRPVATHHMNAFFRPVALNANIAVSTIATARKFVATSVRIVAT
jgi:hypothetical protein